MENRLRGQFNHSVDAKGRMIVPTKLRYGLGDSFILTRGMDGCIYGFPYESWSQFEDTLKDQPSLTSKDMRKVRDYFVGGSHEVELDSQGRVIIPQPLRDSAKITKDVTVVGNIDRIEIWDRSVWEARNTAIESEMEDIMNNLEGLGINF